MTSFEQFSDKLQVKIQTIYEDSISMEQAEKLAAEFLNAQMVASQELRKADLDARMRKQGLKSLRAAIYLKESTKLEKKPTEAALSAILDSNELIAGEQKAYDEAETRSNEVERVYNIFREVHIFLRTVSRGNFS